MRRHSRGRQCGIVEPAVDEGQCGLQAADLLALRRGGELILEQAPGKIDERRQREIGLRHRELIEVGVDQLGRAFAGLDRMHEVLEEQPEDVDPGRTVALGRIQGNVRFENVTFEYEAGKPVLRVFALDPLIGLDLAAAEAVHPRLPFDGGLSVWTGRLPT